MTTEALSLDGLEDQVRSITIAETPAEVFKGLLEGARLAAPRASVFLVRQSQIKGWGAVGYPPASARRQREFVAEASDGWLAEVLQSEVAMPGTDAARLVPSFGQPAPEECLGIAVRLKGRPIALIVIERLSGELPWYPSVLGILVRVAQLRLDLDLARRKSRAPVAPRPSVPAAPGAGHAEALASPGARSTPVLSTAPPAKEAVEAEREPVAEIALVAPEPVDAVVGEQDPQLAAARRYARLVATDIRLYNEEAVLLGRRNGDLAERLRESLARGRETFQRRHGDLGPAGKRILLEAYVEVLAGGQAELLPESSIV